jgi:hypothetical protein
MGAYLAKEVSDSGDAFQPNSENQQRHHCHGKHRQGRGQNQCETAATGRPLANTAVFQPKFQPGPLLLFAHAEKSHAVRLVRMNGQRARF